MRNASATSRNRRRARLNVAKVLSNGVQKTTLVHSPMREQRRLELLHQERSRVPEPDLVGLTLLPLFYIGDPSRCDPTSLGQEVHEHVALIVRQASDHQDRKSVV